MSAVSVSGAASEDNKYMTRLTLTVSISGPHPQKTPLPPSWTSTPRRSASLRWWRKRPAPRPPCRQRASCRWLPLPPSPTPTPVYGPFTPIEDPFTLELDIFPTAEQALGLDITAHYDNELWSVRETGDSFIIEARRFGHGVGMSQRGAQWMAAEHGKTYQEIIAFYYPGLTLMRYEDQPAQMISAGGGAGRHPRPRTHSHPPAHAHAYDPDAPGKASGWLL